MLAKTFDFDCVGQLFGALNKIFDILSSNYLFFKVAIFLLKLFFNLEIGKWTPYDILILYYDYLVSPYHEWLRSVKPTI